MNPEQIRENCRNRRRPRRERLRKARQAKAFASADPGQSLSPISAPSGSPIGQWTASGGGQRQQQGQADGQRIAARDQTKRLERLRLVSQRHYMRDASDYPQFLYQQQ